MTAYIVIPKDDTAVKYNIAPGSGVVARSRDNGTVDIYYEGNLYNASNIKTIGDRIYHAAGRLFQGYPTTARLIITEQAFKEEFTVTGYITEQYQQTLNSAQESNFKAWESSYADKNIASQEQDYSCSLNHGR